MDGARPAILNLSLALVLALAACLPALGQTSADVAILGDSNTWLGGDDCSKPRGWSTWFRRQLAPATCRSYARSGATWTCTEATRLNTEQDTATLADDNVVYNQIERLLADCRNGSRPRPSLIIISAGTNDAWFTARRPLALSKSLPDTTLTAPQQMLTLADAAGSCCAMLRREFPSAGIVLLTPMQSVAVSNSLIERAGDILEQCADVMGLGVVRLDRESPVRSAAERKVHRYTYDGTHTSTTGARSNGMLVARRVKQMLRQKH